jgi:hypothetical protein
VAHLDRHSSLAIMSPSCSDRYEWDRWCSAVSLSHLHWYKSRAKQRMSPVRDQLSLPPAELSQRRLHVLDDLLKAPSPHPALPDWTTIHFAESCEEPFPSMLSEERMAPDGGAGKVNWPPATLAEIAGGRVAPLRLALNIPGPNCSVEATEYRPHASLSF